MSSNTPTAQKSGAWLKPLEHVSTFHDLQRDLHRLAEDISRTFKETTLKPLGLDGYSSFLPKVDVKEDKDNVIAVAELPGIAEKDIEVSVRDDMLILKGEKKSEKEEQQKHYYRIERSHGSFERSLSLPCEVQPNKAEAVFKNGILTVTMPKSAAAKTTEKKLTVKSV